MIDVHHNQIVIEGPAEPGVVPQMSINIPTIYELRPIIRYATGPPDKTKIIWPFYVAGPVAPTTLDIESREFGWDSAGHQQEQHKSQMTF